MPTVHGKREEVNGKGRGKTEGKGREEEERKDNFVISGETG